MIRSGGGRSMNGFVGTTTSSGGGSTGSSGGTVTFFGPTGATGPRGIQGVQGNQGDQGPAGDTTAADALAATAVAASTAAGVAAAGAVATATAASALATTANATANAAFSDAQAVQLNVQYFTSTVASNTENCQARLNILDSYGVGQIELYQNGNIVCNSIEVNPTGSNALFKANITGDISGHSLTVPVINAASGSISIGGFSDSISIGGFPYTVFAPLTTFINQLGY